MPKKTPDELRRQIEILRGKGDVKPREVAKIAKALGRRRDNSRGKEPTYISDKPGWYPISIPEHRTLKKGTRNNILDKLEEDVDRWEEELLNVE